MSKKKLNIKISPEGDVEIDAQGFRGPECEEATRDIERAIGTVQDRKRKDEYYQQPQQDQDQAFA